MTLSVPCLLHGLTVCCQIYSKHSASENGPNCPKQTSKKCCRMSVALDTVKRILLSRPPQGLSSLETGDFHILSREEQFSPSEILFLAPQTENRQDYKPEASLYTPIPLRPGAHPAERPQPHPCDSTAWRTRHL